LTDSARISFGEEVNLSPGVRDSQEDERRKPELGKGYFPSKIMIKKRKR
jgi:hypothetical protein